MELITKTRSGNDLLNQNEAAQILGIKAGTMQVWRATKRYRLPYVKVGRSVRYRLADNQAFIKSRMNGEVEI